MTRASLCRPTLLVVDDEPAVLGIFRDLAEAAGFDVVTFSGGQEAIDHLRRHRVDVAALDLRMPDVGGLEVLRAIKAADPDCQVILMTGEATIDSAVEAIKLGATDYLTKPFDFARLKRLLDDVSADAERRQRLLTAEHEVAKKSEFCGMIGRSPIMQALFVLIRRLAPHVQTALITGETGTGKELVARALYQNGPRRTKRFVTVNCSAVVETLFENELFGHVKGAFTGAVDAKVGLFECANGGTIFLDEVGELPQQLQAKLLRVLESGEIQRVGSVEPRRVDVHVLAATNRDLHAETAAGRFRSDLFYRLSVVELQVPPLRDRRDDIPYLTAAFARASASRLGKRLVGPTPGAERTLVAAPWRGNVRELRNVVERACILAEGEFITEREISANNGHMTPPVAVPLAYGKREAQQEADGGSLPAMERAHIVEVLSRVGGNKMKAAQILGLSRRALYRRIELYGIAAVERYPKGLR